MSTRLFVGNLPSRITEAELADYFGEGRRTVVDVKIVLDRDTGRSRGFAFVELSTPAEAVEVLSEFQGRDLMGRPINLAEAKARSPRPSGGAGYGASRDYGEDTGHVAFDPGTAPKSLGYRG